MNGVVAGAVLYISGGVLWTFVQVAENTSRACGSPKRQPKWPQQSESILLIFLFFSQQFMQWYTWIESYVEM